MLQDVFLDRKMGQWYATHRQTMRDLEHCRLSPFNVKMRIGKGMCRSLANCEPTMHSRASFEKVSLEV